MYGEEKTAGECGGDDDADEVTMHAELVFTLIASDREFAMSEIIVKTNSAYRTSLANSWKLHVWLRVDCGELFVSSRG